MDVMETIYVPAVLPLNSRYAVATKSRYVTPVGSYSKMAQPKITINRITNDLDTSVVHEPFAWATVKTLLKERSELLKQLDEFTAPTSSGSAKVISTHWDC
jgi:hypothetical protein